MKHVEVHISSHLSDEEWNVLRLFCEKTTRLISTRVGSGDAGGIKGHIRYERDTGLTFEVSELPAEEQIAEFLMAFRFFYMQKEPTHLPTVLSIIGKHTNSDEARQVLKHFGREWRDSLFGNAMNISYNDKPITSALLLDLWFNAHYFHQDAEKGKELEKLIEGFSERFAKYMLMDAAFEASKVVFKVYNSVHGIVDAHFTPK